MRTPRNFFRISFERYTSKFVPPLPSNCPHPREPRTIPSRHKSCPARAPTTQNAPQTQSQSTPPHPSTTPAPIPTILAPQAPSPSGPCQPPAQHPPKTTPQAEPQSAPTAPRKSVTATSSKTLSPPNAPRAPATTSAPPPIPTAQVRSRPPTVARPLLRRPAQWPPCAAASHEAAPDMAPTSPTTTSPSDPLPELKRSVSGCTEGAHLAFLKPRHSTAIRSQSHSPPTPHHNRSL